MILPPWVDEGWPRDQAGNALRCPCCGSFELSIISSGPSDAEADEPEEGICDRCERYGTADPPCEHHYSEILRRPSDGDWEINLASPAADELRTRGRWR
jgi:hypothetical protein